MGNTNSNNDFNAWKVFGDAGEQLVLNWLNGLTDVKSAIKHDHSGRTNREIIVFERMHGDIKVLKGNDELFVEVKTDGLLQYTRNVGFEIWQTVQGWPATPNGSYGWAHPNTNSKYSTMFIVAPGVGLIVINNWYKFKCWMHSNPELFTMKTTQTGKSSSLYINIDSLLENYEHCKVVDIDLSSVETLIQNTPMLKDRDDRYKRTTTNSKARRQGI